MLTFDNIAGDIKKTSDQQLTKEEQDQKTKDLSIAVRGVGYFAASVKRLDKEERYKPIFQNLLNPNDWAISKYAFCTDIVGFYTNIYFINIFFSLNETEI